MTTPYWRVSDGKVMVGKGREVYLNPDEEDHYAIAKPRAS